MARQPQRHEIAVVGRSFQGRLQRLAALLSIAVVGAASTANAQVQAPASSASGDADHAIVFEVGAAGDWSRAEGFHSGGTVAFEVTPVEHWLEIESGVTAIRSGASTETSIDLLFKKPWQFSRTVEFMAGAGPEVVHASGASADTFWGVEAIADLMVWPRPNVGWYVEPGYEMTMRDGVREHGLGIAVGLLLGR